MLNSISNFMGGMGGVSGGMGGYSTNPADIARLQYDAQRQQQMANMLMKIGGRDANNWGDVIVSLMAGYKARKAQGKADDSIAKAIEQGLAYESQEKAREEARKRREQEERWAREDARWRERLEAQQGASTAAAIAAEERAQERLIANRSADQDMWLERYGIQSRDQAAQAAADYAMKQQLQGGSAPGFEVPSGYMLAEGGQGVTPIPGGPKDTEAQKQSAKSDLYRAVEEYRGLLEQHGTEYFGDDAAALSTAFEAVKLKMKTAEELGALTGPDMEILENIMGTNPTGLFAQFNLRGGQRRLARIDQYIESAGLGQAAPQEQDQRILADFRAANPGVPDEELIAFARQKGYLTGAGGW